MRCGPTARALGALAVLSAAVAVAGAPEVRYEHERVTAHLRAVPVADALVALAEATGAELRGAPIGTRDVTLELDAVTVDEALVRLLAGQSFTVVYGEAGRVKDIVLRGGPEAPRPPTDRPPAAGVAVADTTPHFPLVLSKIFEHHRPLDLPDPLAERLGEKKLGMVRLFEVATVHRDGVVRSLASMLALTTLERESRYRRSFLRSLHRLDPEALGTIANGPSGERFEELLDFFAVHSREPTLQKKAGIVLDQFREARAGTT